MEGTMVFPEGQPHRLANLDSSHIKIIAYPIAVVLIAEVVAAIFGLHPIIIGGLRPIDNAVAEFITSEAALRFRVLGMFLLLTIRAVAIMKRFESERTSLFDQKTSKGLLRGAAFCLTIAIAIIALSVMNFIPASFDVLGQDLYQRAFELIDRYPDTMSHVMSERILWCLMNVGGLFVGAAIASLIMSAISSLAEIKFDGIEDTKNIDETNQSEDSKYIEARKAHWKLQSERLQLTIYISTGLLVVGLLYIQSWAQWPTFAFDPVKDSSPGEFASGYSTLVNSYLAFTGIEYSLLLASFAIPVTVVLNSQASAIARDCLIEKEKKRVKEKNEQNLNQRTTIAQPPTVFSAANVLAERKNENLVVQFIDQLKTIAAILAPFIAGSLGNFVTLLTTKP
jgi:hypothetical protein